MGTQLQATVEWFNCMHVQECAGYACDKLCMQVFFLIQLLQPACVWVHLTQETWTEERFGNQLQQLTRHGSGNWRERVCQQTPVSFMYNDLQNAERSIAIVISNSHNILQHCYCYWRIPNYIAVWQDFAHLFLSLRLVDNSRHALILQLWSHALQRLSCKTCNPIERKQVLTWRFQRSVLINHLHCLGDRLLHSLLPLLCFASTFSTFQFVPKSRLCFVLPCAFPLCACSLPKCRWTSINIVSVTGLPAAAAATTMWGKLFVSANLRLAKDWDGGW